jgi:peptide/nickel transport system permease protein
LGRAVAKRTGPALGSTMLNYLIKRVLLMIPTILGVAVVIFVLMRMLPGDIVEMRLASEGSYVQQETIDMERAKLGLDKPLLAQFGDYMWGLAHFDFGYSMWTGRPVSYEIGIRFQLSLQIAVMSTIIAVLLAIPLGTLAALKQDTWVDYGVRIFSIAGIATPGFWLGIMIILAFLIVFHWTPPMVYTPIWVDPWANLSQLIWPALATGYRYSAVATRMTRSAVLEVLREDYIRTARAKGLWQQLILRRHALKNAMLPVITVVGLEFAFLLGGLVVTEQVFNLNGIGKLFVDAVTQYDYTLVQALVMIVATVFVMTNFVVDLLYAWLDPRIRYR